MGEACDRWTFADHSLAGAVWAARREGGGRGTECLFVPLLRRCVPSCTSEMMLLVPAIATEDLATIGPMETLPCRDPVRINLGCGVSPTLGWTNYDNSVTVRLVSRPVLVKALAKMQLLSPARVIFARTTSEHGTRFANVVRRIPHADESVDLVYSSHMLEHLDTFEARAFLTEVRRVLVPGGTLRLAVPDLRGLVQEYIANGDADLFMRSTLLARKRPVTVREKARWLMVGDREHSWMYDGDSLVKLLATMEFDSPQVVPAGATTMVNPGALDLREREDESVFVEAQKPL